jgi:peptide chain release factor subunit 3
MIGGCQQADVGVLVISARKGEFETGFERGGQTQEHALLAKTLGVKKLVLAINKMDDPTVEWSQARFDEIQTKLGGFLKKLGYQMNKDMFWVPLSAYTGDNVKDEVKSDAAKWVEGTSLISTLDKLDPLERGGKAGYFRMPVIDKFKDMGQLVIMGKIESGMCKKGSKLIMYPNKNKVEVISVSIDEGVVERGRTGDNVKLQLKGIDEDDLAAGHVLCDRQNPVNVTSAFDCQLQILELLEHKNIFTVGYSCVLHVHSEVQECSVAVLGYVIDPKTKDKKKVKFTKSNSIAVVRLRTVAPVCCELFENFPQLGRFSLRDEGKTIAIGKITGFPKKKE